MPKPTALIGALLGPVVRIVAVAVALAHGVGVIGLALRDALGAPLTGVAVAVHGESVGRVGAEFRFGMRVLIPLHFLLGKLLLLLYVLLPLCVRVLIHEAQSNPLPGNLQELFSYPLLRIPKRRDKRLATMITAKPFSRKWFQQLGAQGGRKSAGNMSKTQKVARARKAGKAPKRRNGA